MGDLRVGTASWTDTTLIDCKRFYSEETKSAEERLRFYATRFTTDRMIGFLADVLRADVL